MKPIYNSIVEDFIDMVTASEIANRKIKYISVTEREYLDILKEIGDFLSFPKYDKDGIMGTLMGVQIVGYAYEYKMKKEDLERTLKI